MPTGSWIKNFSQGGLLDPARPSVPMKTGRVRRSDYEYLRTGTANIFCIVEPKTGRLLTYASANRTGKSFAHAMYRVARRYKSARKIHRKQSLIDALGSPGVCAPKGNAGRSAGDSP